MFKEPTLTLTVKETAVLLGVSLPTAYELAKRKDFPAMRFGRKILVSRYRLEEWVDSQTNLNK